jgi:hypothetical protein
MVSAAKQVTLLNLHTDRTPKAWCRNWIELRKTLMFLTLTTLGLVGFIHHHCHTHRMEMDKELLHFFRRFAHGLLFHYAGFVGYVIGIYGLKKAEDKQPRVVD